MIMHDGWLVGKVVVWWLLMMVATTSEASAETRNVGKLAVGQQVCSSDSDG